MTTDNARVDEAAAYQAQRLRDGAACHAAALDYLARGLAVTCCCPPGHEGVSQEHRKRCKSKGKAPLHRWKHLETALPTLAEVEDWWRHNPTANVGMALGRGSRKLRLDIEGPEGEARLRELSKGDLPPTWTFASGREDNTGRGLIFDIPPGLYLKTAIEGLPLGGELRIQGEGGQTVLPPSRHKDGRLYSWLPGCGPDDIEVAPAPAWLLETLTAKASKGRSARAEGEAYRDPREAVREGGRHTYLLRSAGLLRGRAGASGAGIRAFLLAENEEACDPPLPEDEVLQIADDARKWEQGPRDTGGGRDPRKAATIVLDFWRQKHDPPFKRSGLIYSAAEGRELRDAELL